MTGLCLRIFSKLAVALICASTLVAIPFADDTDAQASTEWECDGTPILMRGGVFHYIQPDPVNPGNLIIEAIPGTSGIWNSTAYDPLTNLVYGVGSIGGEKTVRAYDATGAVVFDTQIQDPYPDNANTYAGTVLGDGRYIIHSVGAGNGNGWYAGARFNLWAVNPTTGAATYIGPTPVNFADFSYNPLDGFLYQAVNRVLYKVDPNTGAVTSAPTSSVLPNGNFGASWFDSAGFLYLFRNNPGDIWRIDPNDPTDVVLVGSPGSDGGTDAASCVSSIDIKKDVVDSGGSSLPLASRVYGPGDTVTYEITLINNGLPTQNRVVDVCDVLPADGRTFTGVWSSTDPGATLTSGGNPGDTSICLEVDMPSSLWTDPATPGADPTVVTIEVVLDDEIAPGTYENQATLDFDQDGAVDLLSDDIGDGSDPRDPTTIEVVGGFEISKVVEGHPVDDDTDEFTVTLSCTTAAGDPHNVAATSIVVAATGTPWPGALTNQFTFGNGDNVRITGVPAGATCTTTEGDDVAYTATVSTSETVAGGGATGATSMGTLTSDLANDNCQDGEGGFTPFNLQVRNTTNTPQDWETIWRNRPYATIPGLSAGNYGHTVVPAPGGLFDHVFTGTTQLSPFGNLTISGGVPSPVGTDTGCGEVENYNGVTAPASGGAADGGAQSPTAELTIDSGISDEQIDYTNRTSTLTIEKESSAPGALALDEDDTFSFEIVCDNGLSETVTVTTSGGTGTIAYPDMPLIADGATCTLSEDVPAGWQLTSANDVELDTDTATPSSVTFTNERQIADLTVTKAVIGLPTGEDPASYTFEVTVTCTGGFVTDPYSVTSTFAVGSPLVIADLPVGSECTIVETPVAGFNIRYSPSDVVEIDAAGSAIQVTNSTGSLIIEKNTQVPTTHPIDPTGSFAFTLECSGGTAVSETYIVDADELTATGATGGVSHTDVGVLAPGTECTVAEGADNPDWTVAGSTTQTLTVTEADPEPTATFLNLRNTGTLTVTKTLDGVPVGIDLDAELFDVTVTCTGGFTTPTHTISGQISVNQDFVIEDLPTGTECSVSEDPDPRFATSTDGPVTITEAGQTVNVTNTTSTFDVEKTTVASALVDDADGTFNVVILCTNAGSEVANTAVTISTTGGSGAAAIADLPLLPPGSVCTLTEIVPDGWTLSDRVGGTPTGSASIQFTTEVGGTDLGFENTLDTTVLTIEKDVTGVAATPALEAESFSVSVECTGNFPGGTYSAGTSTIDETNPIEITGLPPGAECTVTEAADGRFATSYSPSPTVTIEVGGTTVVIENQTSTFTISKETVVDAGGPPVVDDGTFEFSIECSFGGVVVYSDTVEITTVAAVGVWNGAPLLPAGTSCDVTETPAAGWTLVETATQTITTSGSVNESVAFTNTRDIAGLTITKTLIGVPPPLDFSTEPFTVNVTCTGDFDTSPLTLTGLTLISTTPLIIPDIPTGAECTVTEDFDSRFQTLYSPENADGSAAVVTIADDGAQAGITNSGGVLAVRKDTVGPDDHPISLLDDFDFDITCSNGYSDVRTLAVDQMAGPQGIGGITYTELPVFPLGTECTVTEIVPDGWTLSSPNPQVVTITSDPETTDWVNTRDTGTLTVTKTLDGVPAAVDLGDEPFTVDITCTGGGLTVDPYEITGQVITANTPLQIDNLPTGAECSVDEAPDTRFVAAIDAPVTITTGGETLNITNSTSTVSILKVTDGPTTHPIELDGTFSYDIVCQAPDGSEIYSETQSIATTAQSGSWVSPDTPLLPPGSECIVSEQPATGWTLTTTNDVELLTEAAAVAEAAFTNQRDTDTLTIHKTVIGAPTDLSDEEFIVDVSCTGDFTTSPYELTGLVVTENTPISIPDLPTGATCVVSEREDTRFLPSYSPDDQTVIVGTDGSSLDIDNRTGTFQIEKQVVVEGSQPIDLSETFTVDVTCDDGTEFSVDLDIVDGVAVTRTNPDIPLLPDGTACTVTEQGPPTGWTLTTPNDVEVIISSTAEPVVSFTNRRDTADLNVTKTVIGAPADLDVASLVFIVDVTCSGDFDTSPLVFADQEIRDGETITFEDLPTGTNCTVVETPDPRFTIGTTPADVATAGIEVTDAGADVGIVNATGEIMIVKNTQVAPGHPIDVTESFQFAVDCGSAYSGTHTVVADTVTSATAATGFLGYADLPALPDGASCTITEQTPPAGWTLVSANDVVLVVDSAGVVTATFTNERTTGSLTVTKTLVGVPAGTDLDTESFDVRVTCTGGFTTPSHIIDGQISVDQALVVEELPTGASCSVTETPDARFATSIEPAATITVEGEAIAVTNTTSTFSISKTTVGPTAQPIDLDDTFSFVVECEAPDGTVLFSGTQTIATSGQVGAWAAPDTPLLPPGTACTVTEQALAGWTITSTNPQVVSTDAAAIADAAFVNERLSSDLQVVKVLEGVPAGTDLDGELFDVTITCTGEFATPTHIISDQISVDEALDVVDLPTGAVCEVVEAPDARFATAIDTPSVTMADGGAVVTVTNSTSTFSISKTTVGPATHPIELDDTFDFDAVCEAPDGTVLFSATQTISTSGQSGTWATPATPLLPPGTECSVTEQTPPTGWTNTSGDTQVESTDAAAIVDAAFTNRRDTATLTINKTVLGAPDDIDLSDELFDLTIVCTGDFDTGTHIVTGQVSANSPLEVADLPTGATCEVVEASDARFQTSYFPESASGDSATVLVDDVGATVVITNSTGAIAVAKQTVVSPLHPIDPVADFTFTIDCGAVYTADHTLTTDVLTSTGATGVIFYTDLPLIPEGTVCDITELDETPLWTLATERTVTLTASSDDPVTANFVNTRNQTQLSINKFVEGPETVDLDTEVFEVTVTCAGGFTDDPYVIVGQMSATAPFVIDELPYGAECSAVETPDGRFATTDLTGSVTLGDAPAAIDVLNQTGSFTIDLDAIVNSTQPIDPDDDFELTVIFTLPDGTVITESVTISTTDGGGTWASELLPTGTVVTAVLEPQDRWVLTDRDGEPVGADGIELTIGTDVENIGFEVQRQLVTLTIIKELANVPETADFTEHLFTVTVTCDGFGPDPYEVPGALNVSTVASLVIDELPSGSTCEVLEAPHEFFDASYAPANTITLASDDAENRLTITNTGNDLLQEEFASDGSTLAFTGSSVGTLTLVGALLLLSGGFLFARSRRGRESHQPG